jgi:carbon monoxide dehydrogenase subunit G
MQLSNQQSLPVGQAEAWAALNDIELLRTCIPGCESLVATGDEAYEAQILAVVGPVKARFKGRLRLEQLNPPASYTMLFDGQGGAAGHGKGKAQIRLEPQGDDATLLHYTVDASVGGKIAQIGSRLVDLAAQKMAKDFFERFTEALQARRAAAPPAQPTRPVGLLARVSAWLRRLFGG